MPRFVKSKYDPKKESSTDALSVKTQKETGAVVLRRKDEDGCPCGCGDASASKKTTFLMGHDARLRGKLIRAHLMEVGIVRILGKTVANAVPAMAVAKEYKWAKYLDEAIKRRDDQNKKVLAKATSKKGAKRLIKVGKWDRTGQVVAVYRNGKDGDKVDIEYVTKDGKIQTKKGVPTSQTKDPTKAQVAEYEKERAEAEEKASKTSSKANGSSAGKAASKPASGKKVAPGPSGGNNQAKVKDAPVGPAAAAAKKATAAA